MCGVEENAVKSGKMGYERKRKFLFDSSDFHLIFLLVHLEWKYFLRILKNILTFKAHYAILNTQGKLSQHSAEMTLELFT